MNRSSIPAILAVLVLLPFSSAAAQIVRGQVVDSGTAEPLAGSFILLLNAQGDRVGAALADEAGQFIIRAPGSGTYSLRIERIGFATTETPSFDIHTGQTHRERIPVSMEPIRLDGITATGEGRCRTSQATGAATSVLWEEARKALSISEWVRSDPGVPYQTMTWERGRDPVSLSIDEQTMKLQSGVGRSAFNSDNAANLAREGYVRSLGGGEYEYFGVDAATLLSDAFLETHCFTVRDPPRDDPGLVGLGFEPIPSHTRPDIEGTLWLDRASSQLRFIEFAFTDHLLAIPLPTEPFGGRVDLTRLSNGVWTVDEWWIRMPQFPEVLMMRVGTPTGRRSTSSGRDLLRAAARGGLRIREEGGRLLFILPPGRRTRGRSVVQGTVLDSIRGRPLPGATVFLTRSRNVTRSDARGRFVLRDVPEGPNQIAFLHPRADSLGLRVEPVALDVPVAGTVEIDVGIPRSLGCPGVDGADAPAIAGIVVHGENGEPVAGARVRAVWRSDASTTRGSSPFSRQAAMETGPDGRFFLCGFPRRTSVRLTAEWDGREAEVELELEDGTVFQQLLMKR